jgi:hypothetical protein
MFNFKKEDILSYEWVKREDGTITSYAIVLNDGSVRIVPLEQLDEEGKAFFENLK